jgi:hypothetical protein
LCEAGKGTVKGAKDTKRREEEKGEERGRKEGA